MVPESLVKCLIRLFPSVIDAHPMYWHMQKGDGRCLPSTRVGIEVLKYFGFDAEPVVVHLAVANAAFLKARSMNLNPKQAAKMGAWMVEIDLRPRPNMPGWPGHLVVGLRDENAIVDLDLGTYSRPNKNMSLPRAASFEVNDEWWDGKPLSYSTNEGTGLLYRRLTDYPPYEHGGHWSDQTRWYPMVRRVIRAIEAERPTCIP